MRPGLQTVASEGRAVPTKPEGTFFVSGKTEQDGDAARTGKA